MQTNDELTDDVIDETPAGGDEDDHDIAEVSAPIFDLALRKTLGDDQADGGLRRRERHVHHHRLQPGLGHR